MPTIVVVESGIGPDKSVDAADGSELVDVAAEELLPIPFSCRSASCATCLVEVLEGQALLERAEEDELDLLDLIAAPVGARLACQVRFVAGAGLVKLRPL